MKIEKLNDHQIRCTLTSEDLATRNIKFRESKSSVPRYDAAGSYGFWI